MSLANPNPQDHLGPATPFGAWCEQHRETHADALRRAGWMEQVGDLWVSSRGGDPQPLHDASRALARECLTRPAPPGWHDYTEPSWMTRWHQRDQEEAPMRAAARRRRCRDAIRQALPAIVRRWLYRLIRRVERDVLLAELPDAHEYLHARREVSRNGKAAQDAR